MDWIERIFGQGEELTVSQMSLRAFVMFLITLVLIRISGRRSFGLRTAPDNIISITLGAILSRGVVGASPFWGVVTAGLVIAILHRLIFWLSVHNKRFATIISGKRILVYEKGHYLFENMKRALVAEDEIADAVNRITHKATLDQVDKIYIGRSGQFIILEKDNPAATGKES